MKKRVLLLGTFDTKAAEFGFLRDELIKRGAQVVTMDVGSFRANVPFRVDYTLREMMARETAGESAFSDRGSAVYAVSAYAKKLVSTLYERGEIDGIMGMGGGGGTSIATIAMSGLPFGVPKLCISTLASGDTRPFIGGKDIILIPSVVDICGLNSISRKVISHAAAAMAGMLTDTASTELETASITVLLSMFGNTTEAGTACMDLLKARGAEVLVFHAVGTGGEALEDLAARGCATAVLDLTTTEWADELCGGLYSAGTSRLVGPGKSGIPHLIIPGCIDMVNFGSMDSIPKKYRDANRRFFPWSPQAVLMRTNKEENAKMGQIFAEKANQAPDTTSILIPKDGFSALDKAGGVFYDLEADNAFTEALRRHISEKVPVVEVPYHINEPAFAAKAVEMLLELIAKNKFKP